VLLEYLQTLTPDRHGTLVDASEKIIGGVLGIFAAEQLFISSIENASSSTAGKLTDCHAQK